MKIATKLNHTTYNEKGIPVFTIKELAEASIDFVINRHTGEKPDFKSYQETMRKKLVFLLPKNIHRHDNDRIARGETRYTVEDWLMVQTDYHENSSTDFRINMVGMEQKLYTNFADGNNSSFTHYPSENTQKSALLGKTRGSRDTDYPKDTVCPFDDPTTVYDIVSDPSQNSTTSGDENFVDYHKTDQIRVLCNAALKVIGYGKTNFEPDQELADKCFQHLAIGLATLGGVK